jgi:hypothetical protein
MLPRFLSLGVGALALLAALGAPGQVHAQPGRGGFPHAVHPGFHGGFRPGFHRGVFGPPFGPGPRRIFDPRFGRFDRFEDRFENRFGFDRFEDRFERRFNRGSFDPRFRGEMIDPPFRPGV